MKQTLLILVLLSILLTTNSAQEASVEKSIYGVQIGISPLSIYNETKLTNAIALRSELGFGFGWSSSSAGFEWVVYPVLVLEPRYYYNLKKRLEKGKRIDGNSGNRFSLLCGYVPGAALSSAGAGVNPNIFIIPSWGIRRNIGRHFNYEVGFGVGYSWIFKEYYPVFGGDGNKVSYTEGSMATSIRLAIGYQF